MRAFLLGSSKVSSVDLWKVSWSGVFGVSSVLCQEWGVNLHCCVLRIVEEHLLVHVQVRVDPIQHVWVALLRQNEEAPDGVALSVETAPFTGTRLACIFCFFYSPLRRGLKGHRRS